MNQAVNNKIVSKATIKDLIQKQNSVQMVHEIPGGNTIQLDPNLRKLASELSDTVGNMTDPAHME